MMSLAIPQVQYEIKNISKTSLLDACVSWEALRMYCSTPQFGFIHCLVQLPTEL